MNIICQGYVQKQSTVTRLVDPCEELPGRSSRELPAAKVSPGAGSAAAIATDLGVAMERPCRVAGKDSE